MYSSGAVLMQPGTTEAVDMVETGDEMLGELA
jgi:hypothetical protein